MTSLSDEVRKMMKRGEIIPQHIIEQLLFYYESHPHRCVYEFHKAFGVEINEIPTLDVSKRTKELRPKLIEEEYIEYRNALEAEDLIEMFDALLDLTYVIYGTGISHGLPMLSGMISVQESNMSKLDLDGRPIIREDGKILKGPKFFKPDLKSLVDVKTPVV